MRHNAQKFVSNLSAKLATRSRHVCVLLGAGASKACGLPDVASLQASVLAKLDEPYRGLFETQLKHGNLEQALSRVRKIAALLKGAVTSQGATPESVEGLTAGAASTLDELVCEAIVEQLSSPMANLLPMKDLAAWAGHSDYHFPIEIFTVNYDLLLEEALEDQRVAYFDGFLGTLTGRFRTELVEPLQGAACMPSFFIRLWKLHGSLNWAWDDKHQIVRYCQVRPKVAAIYPSDMKYDDSRRMPFCRLAGPLQTGVTSSRNVNADQWVFVWRSTS